MGEWGANWCPCAKVHGKLEVLLLLLIWWPFFTNMIYAYMLRMSMSNHTNFFQVIITSDLCNLCC